MSAARPGGGDAALAGSDGVRPRERRRLPRWLPVTAVVAVAVVAAVVVATRPEAEAPARPVASPPSPTVSRSPEPPAAPAEAITVFNDEATLVDSGDPYSGGAGISLAGYRTRAVTAAGDGRFFYASGITYAQCRSTLFGLERTGPVSLRMVDVPGGDVAGDVIDVAVNAQRTLLAYTVFTRRNGNPGCDTGAQLRVRDLRTGAERVWTGRKGGDFADELSWAPDGRHLAAYVSLCCAQPHGHQGFRVLDTAAPGGSFAGPVLGENPPGDGGCGLYAPAYRGATGELAALRLCGAETDPSVVVVDPATGAVRRTLFTVPGGSEVMRVAFDRSGRHAWVESAGGHGYSYYDRWDGGPVSRGVHVGKGIVTDIAW